MLVQRVLMPVSGRESWTLLGDDGEVVEPAERYLAYLAAIERSPNTVRAYAVSLKLWFEFLQLAAVSWDEAGVEDVARFVAWLRAPAGNVIVLADGTGGPQPGDGQQVPGGSLRLLRSSCADRPAGRCRARVVAPVEPWFL